MEFLVVASEAETGNPKYFDKDDLKQDKFLSDRIRKNYPLAADKLEHRAELYNSCIIDARKYQRDGKLLIISPDDTCGVSTLSRNKNNLISLYQKRYKNGEKITLFL